MQRRSHVTAIREPRRDAESVPERAIFTTTAGAPQARGGPDQSAHNGSPIHELAQAPADAGCDFGPEAAAVAGSTDTRPRRLKGRLPKSARSSAIAPSAALGVPATTPLPDVDLDALSAHWRLVFNAEEDALRAAGRCGTSLQFSGSELQLWSSRLVQERQATAELLDEIAREQHVRLYHRLSAPRATRRTLGLPADLEACVFDLDGVLTMSGALHSAAWAETLNEFLARRVERTGERFAPFRPFNPRVDYLRHIDGRTRLAGVHGFLASRGIRLPEGHAEDPPGSETVHGLANRKNEALLRRLEREGVTAFAGARRYLEAAREAGLRCAVVSASANTRGILEHAGLADLVEERVDGNTIGKEKLAAKPAPDTLLAACRRLGVRPAHAASFETTIAGMRAARTAGFGHVVAVDGTVRPEQLRAEGADLVVGDLGELLTPVPSG